MRVLPGLPPAAAPAAPAFAPDDVLARADVAQLLRVSPKTVSRLPIRCVRIGYRTTRYRYKDVLAYLEKAVR